MDAEQPDVAYNDDPPLPLPDQVDVDLIGRLLLRIEATAHRHGWNHPRNRPHLYLIFDNREPEVAAEIRQIMGNNPRLGPGQRIDKYTAQMAFSPETVASGSNDGQEPPWEVLRRLALNITYTPPEADDAAATMRAVLRIPGTIAWAVCSEGWSRGRTQSRADFQAELDKNYADLPGSVEVRTALAVDALDQVHQVTRLRGKPAQLKTCAPIRGDLSTTLRIIVDMVYSRSPKPSSFAKHYPTILDSTDNDRDIVAVSGQYATWVDGPPRP